MKRGPVSRLVSYVFLQFPVILFALAISLPVLAIAFPNVRITAELVNLLQGAKPEFVFEGATLKSCYIEQRPGHPQFGNKICDENLRKDPDEPLSFEELNGLIRDEVGTCSSVRSYLNAWRIGECNATVSGHQEIEDDRRNFDSESRTILGRTIVVSSIMLAVEFISIFYISFSILFRWAWAAVPQMTLYLLSIFSNILAAFITVASPFLWTSVGSALTGSDTAVGPLEAMAMEQGVNINNGILLKSWFEITKTGSYVMVNSGWVWTSAIFVFFAILAVTVLRIVRIPHEWKSLSG